MKTLFRGDCSRAMSVLLGVICAAYFVAVVGCLYCAPEIAVAMGVIR